MKKSDIVFASAAGVIAVVCAVVLITPSSRPVKGNDTQMPLAKEELVRQAPPISRSSELYEESQDLLLKEVDIPEPKPIAVDALYSRWTESAVDKEGRASNRHRCLPALMRGNTITMRPDLPVMAAHSRDLNPKGVRLADSQIAELGLILDQFAEILDEWRRLHGQALHKDMLYLKRNGLLLADSRNDPDYEATLRRSKESGMSIGSYYPTTAVVVDPNAEFCTMMTYPMLKMRRVQHVVSMEEMARDNYASAVVTWFTIRGLLSKEQSSAYMDLIATNTFY